jgi:hypothetical protein
LREYRYSTCGLRRSGSGRIVEDTGFGPRVQPNPKRRATDPASISVVHLIAGARLVAQSALAGRPLGSSAPRADSRVSSRLLCGPHNRRFAGDHDNSLDAATATVALRSSAVGPADVCFHGRDDATLPALTAALIYPPRVVRRRLRLLKPPAASRSKHCLARGSLVLRLGANSGCTDFCIIAEMQRSRARRDTSGAPANQQSALARSSKRRLLILRASSTLAALLPTAGPVSPKQNPVSRKVSACVPLDPRGLGASGWLWGVMCPSLVASCPGPRRTRTRCEAR